MRVGLICLAFVTALPPAAAQDHQMVQITAGSVLSTPQVSSKRYPISGTVYNSVTNQPIRRALVQISGGQGQQTAFTGADGRFAINDIPEGNVFITAQRPGFSDARTSSSTPYGLSPSTYTVTSGSNEFRVPLTPNSQIGGTVRDADGEPIEGLQLRLTREQIVQGRKQSFESGMAATEDDGSFRFEDLPPGRAFLCTVARPLEPRILNSPGAYPPRCFPNSEDIASAQAIDLAPGQEVRADFTLTPVRSFMIGGTVVGAPPGLGLNIWAEQETGQRSFFSNVEFHPDTGHFVLRSMPAGSWRLHFQANDESGRLLETVEDVTLGKDIEGLQITLQSPAAIPVHLVSSPSAEASAQSGPTGQNRWVQVHLRPMTDGNAQDYNSSFTPKPDGQPADPQRISIENVQPGKYRVTVQAGAPGCVDTVSYGSADVAREPLEVTPGSTPPPLEVALRNDCATVNVNVRGTSATVGGVALLVSDSLPFEPQIVPVQPNSAAALPSLSPGDYRLYALSDVEGLEYANPEAMREVPVHNLHLEPNQNVTVALDVFERKRK